MGVHLVRTLVLSLIALTGGTAQSIIAAWFEQAPLSYWGSLLFIVTSFTIGYWVVLAINACRARSWRVLLLADEPEDRILFGRRKDGRLSAAQYLLLVAASNATAALSSWYSSPPQRTPPLIVACLQPLSLVAAIPLSKWLLGDRKKYWAWKPMLACGMIMCGVGIGMVPQIRDAVNPPPGAQEAPDAIAWGVVYALSCIPSAVATVTQQLYMIRAGLMRPNVPDGKLSLTVSRVLAYVQLCILFWVLAFFWLDILPWFGTSVSIKDFYEGASFSFRCSIFGAATSGTSPASSINGGGKPCPAIQPAYSWSFAGAYVVMLTCIAHLNKESAVFANIIFVLLGMTQGAFLLAFPSTNPNPSDVPVWSTVVSLVLGTAGSLVWKWWETEIPESNQFAVVDKWNAILEEREAAAARGAPRKASRVDEWRREDSLAVPLLGGPSATLN